MGQQSSSVEEAAAVTPRTSFCCGVGSSNQDRSCRSKDTVSVELPTAEQGGTDAGCRAEQAAAAHRKTHRRAAVGLGCNLGLTPVPDVQICDVRSRSATVRWTCPLGKDPRKIHIDVLRLPDNVGQWGASPKSKEVAFFEAAGGDTSFQLPDGVLERASGPYKVEVTMESGTEDRPYLSNPGVSAAFSTPAEPAGKVFNLSVAEEPGENSFRVQWGPPDDDGGSPVQEYEVALQSPPAASGQQEEKAATPLAEAALESDDGSPGEAAEMQVQEDPDLRAINASSPSGGTLVTRCMQHFRTKALSHFFADLPPGSGPYRIEVRACCEAGLPGEVSMLHVSTAVAVPEVPTGLRARLLPGWPQSEGGGPATPRGNLEALGASDVDIVRLEFRAPLQDGGRELESYLIYTVEEDGASKDLIGLADEVPQKTGPAPVCAVAAGDAAGPDKPAPGCPCACDVAVEPNRAYTFSVEASNGVVRSGPSEPAACVFVPARVPLPPRGPPEVFRVEGGFAAELRWVGLVNAGGLPLLSFKIGILGPVADGGSLHRPDLLESEIQREVTVSCTKALAAAHDGRSGISWTPPTQVEPHEAVYGARVEGLQASAQYRFLLAASNAIGTGRWSRPSSPVWTPVAAPAAPVNAVAAITVDKNQRVMVTATWECGSSQAGSGALAAFHIALQRTQAASASAAVEPPVVRERVAAAGCTAGRKVSWATELSQPGHYVVEVVAESTAGQRSTPAALALDVRPETFPAPDPAPDAPHWAEEPVLVLGPVNEGEAQFGDFDPGTWLQALLLWHDSDPNPFSAKALNRAAAGSATIPIDVVCSFRKPGSSNAHVAALATGVTASRLQVALPAHVPMSLRLVVRTEQPSASSSIADKKDGRPPGRVQSEPLLLLMSEGSEHLKPVWEVWSRNSPDGQPPRWRELPDFFQTVLEANWLEGQPKVAFEMQSLENDTGAIAPGHYELTFGDERQVQHALRRVGHAGWNAKVRRTVRDGDGEDAAAPVMAADDQCVICMERRRTHAFMHSDTGDGHLAVCGSCAEAFKAEAVAGSAPRHVRNCPMCRRPFTAVQRIYQ